LPPGEPGQRDHAETPRFGSGNTGESPSGTAEDVGLQWCSETFPQETDVSQEKTQRKLAMAGDLSVCRRKQEREAWRQCSFAIALSTEICLMIEASSLCCTDRMGLSTKWVEREEESVLSRF